MRSTATFLYITSKAKSFFSANKDYIPVSKTLYFPPGSQTKSVRIMILDDLGLPIREGLESFEAVLALPINAHTAIDHTAVIIINDTHSDCK